MSPPAWLSLIVFRRKNARIGCRVWRAVTIAISFLPDKLATYPTSWRTRDAVRSLQEALSGRYPVSIIAVPGPREHIQAHVTLRDGAPLSIDLWPKLPAIARWLPLVLVAQFLLLLFCAWYAVRQVVAPMTRFYPRH